MSSENYVVKDAVNYFKEKEYIINKYLVKEDTRVTDNPLIPQIITYLVKHINEDEENIYKDLIEALLPYLSNIVSFLELLEKELGNKTLSVKRTIGFFLTIYNAIKFYSDDEDINILCDLSDLILKDIYDGINYDNEKINSIYNLIEDNINSEFIPYEYHLEKIADNLNIIHNFDEIGF